MEYLLLWSGDIRGIGYAKMFRAKRIDAINRVILKSGKAWQGLELPHVIRPGYAFHASFDGYSISIYKESKA